MFGSNSWWIRNVLFTCHLLISDVNFTLLLSFLPFGIKQSFRIIIRVLFCVLFSFSVRHTFFWNWNCFPRRRGKRHKEHSARTILLYAMRMSMTYEFGPAYILIFMHINHVYSTGFNQTWEQHIPGAFSKQPLTINIQICIYMKLNINSRPSVASKVNDEPCWKLTRFHRRLYIIFTKIFHANAISDRVLFYSTSQIWAWDVCEYGPDLDTQEYVVWRKLCYNS